GTQYVIPGGFINDNLIISFEPTELVIEKAELTVTPDDIVIEYGETPNFTGTVSGLQYDDTEEDIFEEEIAYLVDCERCSVAASPHIITANATVVSNNYTVNFGMGELTVTPFELTVTVDDGEIQYGSEDPLDFTVSYHPEPDHFPFGETPQEIFGTFEFSPQDACEDVNEITIINPPAAPNYQVTYEAGELTILPAEFVLEVMDVFIEATDPLPTNIATTTTGLVCGDAPPAPSDIDFVFVDPGVSVLTSNPGPGVYEIYPFLPAIPEGLENYTYTVVGGLLIVNSAIDCDGEDFIEVFIECVDPVSIGDFPEVNRRVTLGYFNPAEGDISVPLGPDNQFTGTATVVGEPETLFAPGLNFFDVLIGPGTFRWEVVTPICEIEDITLDASSGEPCEEGLDGDPEDEVQLTSGTDESTTVQIYPNPTRDALWLQTADLEGAIRIEIFNNMGQRLLLQEHDVYANERIPLEVSHLTSGVLWVRVEHGKEVKTLRVVKE
ncbi:MAG: MBG domain-containing protein, partial [Bacteroidota bacterium]